MRAAPGAGGCAAAILRRALRGKEKSFLRARATSGAGGGWGRPGVSRPRDPTGARRSRSCGNACARYRGRTNAEPAIRRTARSAPRRARLRCGVDCCGGWARCVHRAGHSSRRMCSSVVGLPTIRSRCACRTACPGHGARCMSHASWCMARGTGFRAGGHDRHHGRLRARERATRGERPYPKAFKTARRRAQHSSAHSAQLRALSTAGDFFI